MASINTTRTIRRCDIKQSSFPDGYDGHGVYLYSAEVSTSIDGGETYWHCGEGKYCKTQEEAEEYRRNIEYTENGRVFEDYRARLAEDGWTRYNVITYLCSFPRIDADIMAASLMSDGTRIDYDDASISAEQNKANKNRVARIIRQSEV